MSSHSPFRRTSVRSGSITLNAWSWKVLRVALDLLRLEHRPQRRLARRVADAGGVVADDQARRCGRRPGTRAASGARPRGRGGCRARSDRCRASPAAAVPPRRPARASARARPPASESTAFRDRNGGVWRRLGAAFRHGANARLSPSPGGWHEPPSAPLPKALDRTCHRSRLPRPVRCSRHAGRPSADHRAVQRSSARRPCGTRSLAGAGSDTLARDGPAPRAAAGRRRAAAEQGSASRVILLGLARPGRDLDRLRDDDGGRQDLPSLEATNEFKASRNSILLRRTADATARRPDRQREPDPGREQGHLAERQARRGRDRGQALLPAQGSRLPGHRARALGRRPPPERRRRVARRSRSSSSRTRWSRRRTARSSRS